MFSWFEKTLFAFRSPCILKCNFAFQNALSRDGDFQVKNRDFFHCMIEQKLFCVRHVNGNIARCEFEKFASFGTNGIKVREKTINLWS